MSKPRKDLAASIALLAFGAFYFVHSYSIVQAGSAGYGPRTMPRLVGGALILLSLVLMGTSLAGISAEKGKTERSEAGTGEKSLYWKVFATLGSIALFIAVLPRLGFLISAACYLAVQISLLSKKGNWNPVKGALVAVLASLAIYLVFSKLFAVPLPRGLLGF